jgi:hypothetical protein
VAPAERGDLMLVDVELAGMAWRHEQSTEARECEYAIAR